MTLFNLNAFFDIDFQNFDYSEEVYPEFEAISPIEQLIEQEMDELDLIEIVMLPYEDRGSLSPQLETPPPSPTTPHEIEYVDEDDDELVFFTDVCDDTLLRPVPISALECTDS